MKFTSVIGIKINPGMNSTKTNTRIIRYFETPQIMRKHKIIYKGLTLLDQTNTDTQQNSLGIIIQL